MTADIVVALFVTATCILNSALSKDCYGITFNDYRIGNLEQSQAEFPNEISDNSSA